VEYADNNFRIEGFVGQPHLAKQSRAGQFLFLNARPIISRPLSHAVFQPFEHQIDKNHHPFYVLNLALDPTKVDVNVHPQKHEVKFDDERGMYNAVHAAVSDALKKVNLIPELQFTGQAAESPFEKVQIGAARNDYALVNRLTGEIIEQNTPIIGANSGGNRSQFSSPDSSLNSQRSSLPPGYHLPEYGSPTVSRAEQTAFDALFGGAKSNVDADRLRDVSPQQEQHQMPGYERQPSEYPMWQLHNKYVFVQSPKGVIVIDQHNAHERILYERALAAMNAALRTSQELLFPAKMMFAPDEATLVAELAEDLRSLGFDFDISPNGEATVRGVPPDVRGGTEESALREIIEQYTEYNRLRHTEARDNLAASFACKAAIKTGEHLTFPEMKQLVEDLFATSTPYVCPHGRPVILDFALDEFDRRFGRTS